jgi:hypothetical protein
MDWNERILGTSYFENDHKALEVLKQGIISYYEEDIAQSPFIRTFKEFRLGEVSRHFDTTTTATINGWMNHEFRGMGVGIGFGKSGLGVGTLGLGGSSSISLTSTGTDHDDLMGDGFVAVIENTCGKRVDTLRIISPPENEIREWVEGFLVSEKTRLLSRILKVGFSLDINTPNKQIITTNMINSVRKNLHCVQFFKKNLPSLLDFEYEVSYVSDRLHSILRMPQESQPLITVYGAMISEHAAIPAAICFDDDEQIPLFPIILCSTIPQLIDKAVDLFKD